MQIVLRRQIAKYKRRKYVDIWPIDPKSATPPAGWKGWPGGKQFAFVLSHDVDNHKGQNRVLDLARLEMKLGFRSAFNFVPERYTNHEDIKQFLRDNGFEIGVHGLTHDGRLFKNKKIFDRRAQKINRYLKDWKATGFTSPSMHHNLPWMHALDITYSMSTFDTDPFEPQADGVGTIFPFVVYENSGQRSAESSHIAPFSHLSFPASQPPSLHASQPHSLHASQPPSFQASQLPRFFIELPYTMPQDNLMFIILQERSIEVWKRKLDWLAEKGGMVLLKTHSDYMKFNRGKPADEEYPTGRYVELLNYLKSRYEGRFWHATPLEIAAYCKNETQ